MENNKLTNNGYGIRLASSSECTVSKNTVMDNGVYGIVLGSSSSNIISENMAYNSSRGIYLGSSDSNLISGNKVTFNDYLGFYECSLCDDNKVYNNYFNNTNVTVKSGSGNFYNTTKTAGTNIIGGPYIAGNYWGKPDGTGFSDTAIDNDGDGISDSAYRIPGDSTYSDYLPLVYASNSPDPLPPIADFSSNITSGNAPLDVSFTDKSIGNPAAWNWDFGDGNRSSDQNPAHTYSAAGNYTVTLTVSNEKGTASKSSTITVLTNSGASLPIADFNTNATQGSAPLSIQFTDLSQNATWWDWDFGDGSTSIDKNPVHVYEDPGDYTVSLKVSNEKGTGSKTLGIKVLEKEGFPVADFEANITSGYAPLSVLFTDRSQGATQIDWDLNEDGVTDTNSSTVVYVYTSPGSYDVNLIATNENGTDSKTITIDVNKEHNEESSHSSGGGGGGGTGGSPEPQKNVEVKELTQVFITNGKAVKFDFTKNATCVIYVGFDAIKNVGKTTTIAEQLKNKSSLVPKLPEGEVYRFFNVWVGNSGYATSENIENPVLCFKVEKSWLQNESIDKDSITLNRYEDEEEHDGKDGTWTRLPANLTGEDDKYLYFTADVPGYSFFAITGAAIVQQKEDENNQLPAEERSAGGIQSEKNATQGAESEENSRNDLILSVVIVIAVLGVIGFSLKNMKK